MPYNTFKVIELLSALKKYYTFTEIIGIELIDETQFKYKLKGSSIWKTLTVQKLYKLINYSPDDRSSSPNK